MTSKAEHLKNASREKKLRSWQSWQKDGIDVALIPVPMQRSERETAISFIEDGAKYAEVTTANYQWQRRLESLNCKPASITRFKDMAVEIRYYPRVPKKYIRMPSAGRKKGEQ